LAVSGSTARRAPGLVSPAELTRGLKERGKEIGVSAVGVAIYDERWVFEPYRGDGEAGDRVVICIVEQNWEATQRIPSARSERSALNAYGRGIPLTDELAEFLRCRGYSARAGDAAGRMMVIPFAVAAGLGQLGLNGQLLSPFAGSRCRLFAITTNAPLVPDAPVDYGIPAICDSCQICVRRCPSGAIRSTRSSSRGVTKAKIKTERCVPMMVAADGCAVCMKVCPVQRYGLPAVIDEYRRTGEIKGKGTDELEGYHWPVDRMHYGPGEKPRHAVSNEFLHPEGLVFDANRTPEAVRVEA
jgi:epoxyqueuosine reductase